MKSPDAPLSEVWCGALIKSLDVGKVPRFFGEQDSAAVTSKTPAWAKFVRNRGLPVGAAVRGVQTAAAEWRPVRR